MARSNFLIPEPAPTLAVVMADDQQRESVLDQLMARGLAAWGAADELSFYRELAIRKANIVLVDLGLPHEVGPAIVRHLQTSGAYGLMALVDAGQESLVRELGLQGQVSKPVNAQHLLYAIAMFWEHCQQAQQPSGWWLDPDGPRLVAPNGRGMPLTTNEQRLVGGLMACYGQTLSKEQLIALLWGKHCDRDYHGVEVLLSRLRRKAQKALGEPLPIRAVQAIGLVFAGQVRPNVP